MSTTKKKPKIIPAEQPDVEYATNGLLYDLNWEEHTARLHSEPEMTSFAENHDTAPLQEELSNHNTKILYQLIKPVFHEVVRKHNRVHVMDFKIWYVSHGYKIVDLRNGGETVNVNKWHNDYDTPEKVLIYLRSMVGVNRIHQRTLTAEEVERGHLLKLQSLGKIKLTEQGAFEVAPKEKSVPRLLKEVLKMFDYYVEGRYSYRETTVRLTKRLPENYGANLRKPVVKLFTDFKKGELSMRWLKFHTTKMITDYLTQKNAVVYKEAVKKFVGVPLWEPYDLTFSIGHHYGRYHIDSKVIRFSDEVDSAVMTEEDLPVDHPHLANHIIEPDIMWMKFKTQGPSGDSYDVECTVEEYFGTLVLYYFPKAMPLMMKIAKGEKFDLPTVDLRYFVRDETVEFDRELLRHPDDRDYFCRACKFLLGQGLALDLCDDTCFEWMYDSGYKKGEKVWLQLEDSTFGFQWYKVIVVSDKGEPLEVRFEDGSTMRCAAYQKVLPGNAFK